MVVNVLAEEPIMIQLKREDAIIPEAQALTHLFLGEVDVKPHRRSLILSDSYRYSRTLSNSSMLRRPDANTTTFPRRVDLCNP